MRAYDFYSRVEKNREHERVSFLIQFNEFFPILISSCSDGVVSMGEYMSFMISRETENVGSSEEVINAFKALTEGGKRPYVTEAELYQVGAVKMPKLCDKSQTVTFENNTHFPQGKSRTPTINSPDANKCNKSMYVSVAPSFFSAVSSSSLKKMIAPFTGCLSFMHD